MAKISVPIPIFNIVLDGSIGKKDHSSGYWASEDGGPGARDKKFEGYSNLKAGIEKEQKKTQRLQEN